MCRSYITWWNELSGSSVSSTGPAAALDRAEVDVVAVGLDEDDRRLRRAVRVHGGENRQVRSGEDLGGDLLREVGWAAAPVGIDEQLISHAHSDLVAGESGAGVLVFLIIEGQGPRLRLLPVDADGAVIGELGNADAALLTPAHPSSADMPGAIGRWKTESRDRSENS